jgi:stringent starvation protein B
MESDQLTKQAVLERLLELGMVMVTIDARREGVEVPPHLTDDAQLRLNLSFRFGLPMEVGDWGVEARLTFGGVPFNCRLPWDALYIVFSHVTGQPFVFPQDVPPEVLSDVAPMTFDDDEEDDNLFVPLQEAGPSLTLVNGEQVADKTPQDPESPPAGERRRGHLRVVK